MSDSGRFTIALVGCVGSMALAGIARMAGAAASRVVTVVIGQSVVVLNVAAGTWIRCGVLSHSIAHGIRPIQYGPKGSTKLHEVSTAKGKAF